MFSCKYGVTLKAPVLKNICERLLLNGRHWYSTNEILKFYYWDKMEISPFSFSWFLIKVLFLDYIFFGGSRKIAPEENCSPNAKLTLSQTLTLNGRQFSSGAIVWLSPNPKTNPGLDPNLSPNRGQFSSGGNCPDTIFLLRNLYIYARNITNIVDVWSSF